MQYIKWVQLLYLPILFCLLFLGAPDRSILRPLFFSNFYLQPIKSYSIHCKTIANDISFSIAHSGKT